MHSHKYKLGHNQQSLSIILSEMPHIPGNVQVFPSTSSQILQTPFSVHWSAPDNIHRFDLDYYQIKVTTLATSQETPREYYLNTTSTMIEYPFRLLLNSNLLQNGSVNVTVSAFSGCSQQSLPSNRVIIAPYTGSTMMPSADNQINLNTAGNGIYFTVLKPLHYVLYVPSRYVGFQDSHTTLYKGIIITIANCYKTCINCFMS